MSHATPLPARIGSFLAGLPFTFLFAIRRFPTPFLFALAGAAAAITGAHASQWHLSPADEGAMQRILLLWPLAIPSAVGLALFFWSAPARHLAGQAFIALAAAALWFLLPAQPKDAPGAFWFGYWMAVAAIVLASLVITCGSRPRRIFWDAAWPLLSAVFLAGIGAVLAIIGVNLALLSVDKLFNVHFNEAYGDVFFAGFFLLWPAGAILRLSSGLPAPPVRQPVWLLGFARWVFLPLCATYAAILYVYSGKILLARHWPEGWVALPVLLLGAVGMLAYQIARPASDRDSLSWARIFCRALPWILGPLSILLLLGIRVRVVEYGFTEWRLLGLLLGSWLIAVSFAIAWRPRSATEWLPLSLAALIGITCIGPLSVPSLSLSSQQKRLLSLVTKLGLLDTSSPPKSSREIGDKIRNQLEDDLRYVIAEHGAGALPGPIVTRWKAYLKNGHHEAARSTNTSGITNEILASLGITSQPEWWSLRLQCDAAAIPLQGFSAIHVTTVSPERSDEADKSTIGPFQLTIREDALHLSASGKPVAESALASLCQKLARSTGGKNERTLTLPAADLTVAFDWENRHYRLVFTSLEFRTVYRESAQNPVVTKVSALLLAP